LDGLSKLSSEGGYLIGESVCPLPFLEPLTSFTLNISAKVEETRLSISQLCLKDCQGRIRLRPLHRPGYGRFTLRVTG
jgi:hypothetical protein